MHLMLTVYCFIWLFGMLYPKYTKYWYVYVYLFFVRKSQPNKSFSMGRRLYFQQILDFLVHLELGLQWKSLRFAFETNADLCDFCFFDLFKGQWWLLSHSPLILPYSARNNTILCHLDNTSLCVDFPLECYKFTVILFVAKSKRSLENPKPRYDPPLSH